MAAKKQAGRKTNTKSKRSGNNGQSAGMTEMVMDAGRKAGRGLASMIPDALGGRALLSAIKVEYETLRDLFIKELQDLWSAENQLLEALPQMAEASSSAALREAFQSHLKETEGHVARLRKVFESIGQKPSSHTCKAMQGLVGEGSEWMRESATPGVMDAGLIAAGQRVEHYEMAGYGCVRTYAELLGDHRAAELLQATLDEEGKADKKLTQLAKRINVQAAGSEAAEPKAPRAHRPAKGKRPRRKQRA